RQGKVPDQDRAALGYPGRTEPRRRRVRAVRHRPGHPGFGDVPEAGDMTNPPEDFMQWDEAVRHLVRAHGADARRLEAYALPLAQLRWVHFDTHAALDIAQTRPPDGHAHAALPDPGRPGSPDQGYRPFPTAPGSAGGLADWRQPRFMAMRRHTGLPQT